MSLPKLTVVGAGNVGATLAQRLVEQNLGNVVLLDIAAGLAKGKALDLNQSAPILGFQGRVTGTSDYRDTAGSDIVVVTSGSPRKPGMSRDDLLKTNFSIVASVVKQAVTFSPRTILMVVTNPLDAMVYTALKVSGFPRQRVLGMAGVLDSARFRYFISESVHVSPEYVEATIFGGHGDDMVPCLNLATIEGKPIISSMPVENLEALISRTRQGGAEIVKLLQTGSAFYAPSAAAARMVAAILKDEKTILPCAVRLEGEYGYENQILGVPVVLGKNGMEEIPRYQLSQEETTALHKSSESVAELCRRIDSYLDEET